MAEYQITYWREIPSMVAARDASGATSKVSLPNRFQEAIDEAAMRAGASDADAYLADWRQADWQERDGDPGDVAEAVAAELDAEFSAERIAGLLGEEA
jgi:Virulence factor